MGKVTEEEKFVKFDAKSLKRAKSQIVETDGRTQSGVFLVPRSFPAEAIERIEQQARENEGTSKISCAQANATILHQAGFTVGGESVLDQYVLPTSLLRDFLVKGLEYEGKKIEFDIVVSTPLSFSDFFSQVKTAERLDQTFLRHLGRHHDTPDAAEKRRDEAKRIKEKNESEVILATPSNAQGNTFDVRVGKTTGVGNMLRKVWGAHVIYEVSLMNQNEIEVSDFLPDSLSAFPQENPSWGTWVKKKFLFNPMMVGMIHSNMACDYTYFSALSEYDFLKMILPHSPDAPNKYNFVLTGDQIIISQLDVGNKTASWALSKHVLLANYSKDVRFAGEFWKGSDNVIYFNNNSGTYKPTTEHLEKAEQLLQTLLSGVKVQGVTHVEE
jgi:hypothetical protein